MILSEMVRQIQMFGPTADRSNMKKLISLEEYEDWQRLFTLEALRGVRYGQSFCNQFEINDNILYYTTNINRCDQHIRKHYVSKRP